MTHRRGLGLLPLVAAAVVAVGLGRASAAVTLTYFTATPGPDSILLKWETATETDTAGFYILRKTSDQPPWDTSARLRDGSGAEVFLLAASLDDPLGGLSPHEYNYRDATAEEGIRYFYVLQELDLYGELTAHWTHRADALIAPVLSPTPSVTGAPTSMPTGTPTLAPSPAPSPTPTPTVMVAGLQPTITPPRPSVKATQRSGTPLPTATTAPAVVPAATATRAIPPTVTLALHASPPLSLAQATLQPAARQPGSTTEPPPGAVAPTGALTRSDTLTPEAIPSWEGTAGQTPTPVLSVTPSRSPSPVPFASRAMSSTGPGGTSNLPIVAVLGGALILGLIAFSLTRLMAPGR